MKMNYDDGNGLYDDDGNDLYDDDGNGLYNDDESSVSDIFRELVGNELGIDLDIDPDVEASPMAADEEESEGNENTFDLGLPVLHRYLGQSLEELRGRTILDDGVYVSLPLLPRQFVVLFPGETLPMRVFNEETISMLQNCIENNRTFGVVPKYDLRLVPIGTTAEIYEYKQDSPLEGFCLKAKARQRFKILRMMTQGNGTIMNVKILPEITLGPPLYEVRLASLDHCRMPARTEADLKRREKIENADAMTSPWPAWVYRQYDATRLCMRVRKLVHFMEAKGCVIPTDPTELSFWVAQHLLVDNNERVTILHYDSPIQRLRKEIEYLTEDTEYICRYCSHFIGSKSEMFAMSKEGPQGTYCNPAGVIFEILTLHQAQGLRLSGNRAFIDCSWFPGYAWTIAHCKVCETHMGWRFIAVDSKLKPKTFWGLLRKCLKTKEL